MWFKSLCYRVLFLLVLVLNACSPYEALIGHFNSYKYIPIALDSLSQSFKSGRSIYLEPIVINDVKFPEKPIVRKRSSVIVPLLIVTVANYSVYCEYGNAMSYSPANIVSDEILNHVFQKLSPFNLLKDTSADYQLKVSIDSLRAYGTFKKNNFVLAHPFGYHFSFNERLSNTKCICKVSFVISKKGKVLHVGQSSYNIGLVQNPTLLKEIKAQQEKATFFNRYDRDLKSEFSSSLHYSINYALRQCLMDVYNQSSTILVAHINEGN